MSDTMKVQPFRHLLSWILRELDGSGSIFGIPSPLLFRPTADSADGGDVLGTELFGSYLATPIGPAAGPHTQLAQNIVSSWLSGGRFIELKTVQIMDELEIPRPCIDMEDEGYNVEWSQELRLDDSAHEYINAWALIHILRRVLGMEGQVPFGTIFNMSVGYNLEGIQSGPMVRFMDRLEDASAELAEIRDFLRSDFPQFSSIEIPPRLTNSVTLSTMHGCPPDEIEQIARYLLEERGLHTIVKLNPTLLGKDRVLAILHDRLGFRDLDIPDSVFAHDLQYERAVRLIASLKATAASRGLFFGVKLSNTLAVTNHKGFLPGEEMYMSGRALYPLTMDLFHTLVQAFEGDLNVSYAGGADALNVVDLLAAGAMPVTAASDLLKPGGYSRFAQWLERIQEEMRSRGLASLRELASDPLANLERAADASLIDPRYGKEAFPYGLPKVQSGLELFDCIAAPCVEQCAVCQDVPEYAWLIAQGAYDQALEVILHRNPLPGVTGYVCTHLCQTRCTRNNYDEPVAIRGLKRFAFEHGQVSMRPVPDAGKRVAIVGSGPSGLAAAYFLSVNGVRTTLFEAREMAGGMLAIAPDFRLPPDVVQRDIDRIIALGAEIRLNSRISVPPQSLLDGGFDAVYLACGFQKDAVLDVEGIDGVGVLGALRFLEMVARGERPALGTRVLVIGGGNTAMDAARTARRLTGHPVTVVYRRTRAEMPAENEELRDLFDEGNLLIELASPGRVVREGRRVVGLECVRNELGEPDASGRRKPMPIPGSDFRLDADSIIVAIGQTPELAFLDGTGLRLGANGAIATDPGTGLAARSVYAGGDVARGPAIIIQACADGRMAAEAICRQFGIPFAPPPASAVSLSDDQVLQVKQVRARKTPQHRASLLPADQRGGFALVEQTLGEEAARAEAARCLQCSSFCDKCVEVCPNRANHAYHLTPVSLLVPRLACRHADLAVVGDDRIEVTQARQIVHVDDFCNECGNCATFCVHQGRPFADKPRLFLGSEGFSLEADNAFHIQGNTIRRRDGGKETCLTVEDGTLKVETEELAVLLNRDFSIVELSLHTTFDGERSLVKAAEMMLLYDGLTESAPFLLRNRQLGE